MPPPPHPRQWGQDKFICDVAYEALSRLIEKQRSSAEYLIRTNAVPLLVTTLGRLVSQCKQVGVPLRSNRRGVEGCALGIRPQPDVTRRP